MNDNDLPPSIWEDRRAPLQGDDEKIDLITLAGLAAIRRAVQRAILAGLATPPPPPPLIPIRAVAGKKGRNASKADSQATAEASATQSPR